MTQTYSSIILKTKQNPSLQIEVKLNNKYIIFQESRRTLMITQPTSTDWSSDLICKK